MCVKGNSGLQILSSHRMTVPFPHPQKWCNQGYSKLYIYPYTVFCSTEIFVKVHFCSTLSKCEARLCISSSILYASIWTSASQTYDTKRQASSSALKDILFQSVHHSSQLILFLPSKYLICMQEYCCVQGAHFVACLTLWREARRAPSEAAIKGHKWINQHSHPPTPNHADHTWRENIHKYDEIRKWWWVCLHPMWSSESRLQHFQRKCVSSFSQA